MNRGFVLGGLLGLGVLALGLGACSGSPPVQDTDASDFYEAQAEELAESYGLENPPDVEQVRVIALSEWSAMQISCLNDAGFEATKTADGEGVQYPMITDPALQESLAEAIYTCEVQYPVDKKYTEPLSVAQLEHLYEYRSTELVSCLEGQGESIEGAPPSRTSFIESEGAWSPYEFITFSDAKEFAELNALCPQTPESLYDLP